MAVATAVLQEERILWDLQQSVSELERIPGALMIVVLEQEEEEQTHPPPQPHPPQLVEQNTATTTTTTTNITSSISTCWSAHHRRALRRLDRVLEQLEKNSAGGDSSWSASLFPFTNDEISSNNSNGINSGIVSGSQPVQLQQDPESHFSLLSSASSSSSLQIQELLLILLTRLEIPLIHTSINIINNSNHDNSKISNTEETTPALLMGQLVACILERIVAILWDGVGGRRFSSWLLLPEDAVVALLRRLMQCRDNLINSINSSSSNNNFVWNAALVWLSVLNQQFHVMFEQQQQQQQQGDPDPKQNPCVTSTQSIWQQPWFLLPTAAECLRTALDMLTTHAPSWEETTVENVATETRVQWRILTGYLWAWLVRQQQLHQQQQHSNSNAMDMPRWLCHALHQAEPNLPSTVVANTVQNILHTLLKYVTELTNHALDALDEAAVAFQSSSYSHNDVDGNNAEDAAQQQMEAWITAEYAVQNSLRQVALAMHLLQTLQPWSNDDVPTVDADTCFAARLDALLKQQVVHLWVTLAPAFLERSHVTTVLNYKQQQHHHVSTDAQKHNHQHSWEEDGNDNDLGYRICHLRLQLAEMVLSSSSYHPNTMPKGNSTVAAATTTTTTSSSHYYETSLCLTFLRGLEYPELLWTADTLWHELERRTQQQSPPDHHRDLRRMLRAAVLTLRKEYMLPVVEEQDHEQGSIPSSTQQQQQQSRHQRRRAGAHAIVQRLLPLLWTTTATKDPWDGFFWRQSAGLIPNNHSEEPGEGHE